MPTHKVKSDQKPLFTEKEILETISQVIGVRDGANGKVPACPGFNTLQWKKVHSQKKYGKSSR